MPDCSACSLTLTFGDSTLTYCDTDIPNVQDISDSTFSVEATISADCDLAMIWTQIPTDETCCKELELSGTNFDGTFKRQLIPLNGKSLYYNEESGVQDERSWIAFSQEEWVLSSNKYALPGLNLHIAYFYVL